jgi:tetratricopeptide (TPR) repeat protein
LELFEKATLEMSAQNYQLAIDLYEKSYFLDSNNYSALIGLGKSHAKMEYYGKAIQYYNQAKQVQPMINESNTLLASALLKKGESSLALKVCKNSLLVYPEESIFSMMYSILDKQNKQLQRNWVLRLAPINNVDDYYHRGQLFNDQLHFIYYRNALETAKEYYDLNGLLKEGVTLPISQYLEVYCWEKMLEATEGKDVPALSYARYIYNKGLLEPYVLINLFNVDLYAQFHHFVENKENVALDFINQHLISNGF